MGACQTCRCRVPLRCLPSSHAMPIPLPPPFMGARCPRASAFHPCNSSALCAAHAPAPPPFASAPAPGRPLSRSASSAAIASGLGIGLAVLPASGWPYCAAPPLACTAGGPGVRGSTAPAAATSPASGPAPAGPAAAAPPAPAPSQEPGRARCRAGDAAAPEPGPPPLLPPAPGRLGVFPEAPALKKLCIGRRGASHQRLTGLVSFAGPPHA